MARDHARIYTAPPMPPGVDTGRSCVRRTSDGSIKRLAIPAATRRAVALRYGAVPQMVTFIACQHCGAPGLVVWVRSWVRLVGLTFDHVFPYSRGGSNCDPDNFVIACQSCNSRKGDRLDWVAVR